MATKANGGSAGAKKNGSAGAKRNGSTAKPKAGEAKRIGPKQWPKLKAQFAAADDAGKVEIARKAIGIEWTFDPPDEFIDVIELAVQAIRRTEGPDAADRFLAEVEGAQPELASLEAIRLLVLRAEDALLAGRSPAEPAREAAEWWEADPAPFFRLVEHMAWVGSADLMPVLATAVHDDEDEDWDDDEDDDEDEDGGEGGGDFDDDEDDDDDWDEEDALDGEDLDDPMEECTGDEDDEEYEYCGCGEHGEIEDWHARLLPMFSGLLALDAVKRGRLADVRAGLVQAGVGETATAVTEGLVRMAGLAPEDVRAGALRKAEGEDLAKALVDLMYDFARYLRDAHAWPAPRAMLAAQRITELVLFRGDEVAGRGADRPWCFDPTDAAEAVRAAAADGFPHSSAALAAGLPLWEDFLGATRLVKPADARARAAAVRAALGS